MEATERDILFISDLERLLGERRHVLDHAMKSYRIDPAGRAGIIRYWTRDQLDVIRSAVARSSDPSKRRTVVVFVRQGGGSK